MKRKSVQILPRGQKMLAEFGENLKLARLRRRLTAEQVAERAGISRATLWSVEKGSGSVAMGSYFQVLFVLGLEQDLVQVGRDDELGRKLQDAGLLIKKRTVRPRAVHTQRGCMK